MTKTVRRPRGARAPRPADAARLRRELRRRDDDYERRYRVGYVGLWLPLLYAYDWDYVAAWLAGQDQALRDGRRLTDRAYDQRRRLLTEGWQALGIRPPERPF